MVSLVGPDGRRLKARAHRRYRTADPWHSVERIDDIPALCLRQWLQSYAGHTYSLEDDIIRVSAEGAPTLLRKRRREEATRAAKRSNRLAEEPGEYMLDQDGQPMRA